MCDIYLSRAVVLQLHPPAPQADHQVNVALNVEWDDDNICVNPLFTAADFPIKTSMFLFRDWTFLSNFVHQICLF